MNRLTDLVNELTTYFLTRDAWRDWTPTVEQSSPVTVTVANARYIVMGNLVIVNVKPKRS